MPRPVGVQCLIRREKGGEERPRFGLPSSQSRYNYLAAAAAALTSDAKAAARHHNIRSCVFARSLLYAGAAATEKVILQMFNSENSETDDTCAHREVKPAAVLFRFAF